MASALEQRRVDWKRDGVVLIQNAIPLDQVASLRTELEDVFAGKGVVRSDQTAAAAELRAAGKAARLLEDGATPEYTGRFLAEAEAGRWHDGLRTWEHKSDLPRVVGELLNTQKVRFFGDHLFLKEAGSKLHTSYHQDYPYFPFEGDQAAICWVCVDKTNRENGAMKYVRGSHKWPQTNLLGDLTNVAQSLVTSSKGDDGKFGGEGQFEADLEQNNEILSFDTEPGDVIIHHPNMVHGSAGNASANRRRLAASIRYLGDDVVWKVKTTDASKLGAYGGEDRTKQKMRAAIQRMLEKDGGYNYRNAVGASFVEMQEGEPIGSRECSDVAYPVVWQAGALSARL